MTIGIRIALAGLALGLGACATTGSLDLQQLRIVDKHGVTRMVLAGNMPGAGRKVEAGGVIFNDANGHEIGGIGLVEKGQMSFLCFDYRASKSEAICIGKSGTDQANVSINEPARPGNHSGGGSERVSMSLDHGRSQVLLSDSHEKPRIRLSVDAGDVARVEVLDADGKVVYSLPPAP